MKQGDIIWLDFDPTIGSEQSGKRPAVVVSNNEFSKMTNQTLVCPITNTNRKSPLHVEVRGVTGFKGFVMCDQLRAVDLRKRQYNATGKSVTAKMLDLISEILTSSVDT